jgi:hypothetical protein
MSFPTTDPSGTTWEAVAVACGVTRQSLVVWRKMPGAPGGCDIPAWKKFIDDTGLGKPKATGSLKDEKTRHEIEILKAKLDREHRRVIDREEVNRLLLHLATDGRTMLYQFLETELPPKLDGMSAVQMRPILREVADSIADRMAGLISQFEKQ